MYDELSVNATKTPFSREDEEEGMNERVISERINDNFWLVPNISLEMQDNSGEVNSNDSDDNNNHSNNSSEVQNFGDDFEDDQSSIGCKEVSDNIETEVISAASASASGTVTLEIDDKKRPLSVTSTSSSSSSACSLSCNRRKKLASCTMMSRGGIMTSSTLITIGDNDDGIADSLATVSEVLSGDCSCDSSSYGGGGGRAFQNGVLSYSDAMLNENHRFSTRERFQSFSERSSQTLPMRSHRDQMYPNIKSKIDVIVTCTDSDESVGVSQTQISCEGDVLVPLSDLAYVDRVVMEIIETERTYVKDLKDINQGYMDYLNKHSEFHLEPLDRAALFGNMREIYAFNRNFLELLEETGTDPTGIAECFVNQTDGFAIYSEYCTNYPRSMEVLTQCMKDEMMAAILKRQQMSLRHALPLGSYLLKPVQRILKYHLLLLNILNHHDSLSSGHDVIQEAVDSMTSMARHINDMKQHHEHAVHTQEIQSMLYGWDGADLMTVGDLVLEDKFRMSGAKAERVVFLFQKAVLIAKKKDDGSLVVKDFIMCYNLMLIESIPKEPLCFHMIPFDCPRVQHTVQARNLDQKRLWCQQLKQLILDNYTAAIPDKAKQLVMMLGKSREEEMFLRSGVENNSCEHIKKQHSAPHYLQKSWRGRRKSAGLIFDFKLKSRSGPRKSDPFANYSSDQPSPQMRRNSDVVEFCGEILKQRENSVENSSPCDDKEPTLKKKHFFGKERRESNNSAASVENIRSARSAEVISSDVISDDLDRTASISRPCALKVNNESSSEKNSVTLVVPSHCLVESQIQDVTCNSVIALASGGVARKDSVIISKTKLNGRARDCKRNAKSPKIYDERENSGSFEAEQQINLFVDGEKEPEKKKNDQSLLSKHNVTQGNSSQFLHPNYGLTRDMNRPSSVPDMIALAGNVNDMIVEGHSLGRRRRQLTGPCTSNHLYEEDKNIESHLQSPSTDDCCPSRAIEDEDEVLLATCENCEMPLSSNKADTVNCCALSLSSSIHCQEINLSMEPEEKLSDTEIKKDINDEQEEKDDDEGKETLFSTSAGSGDSRSDVEARGDPSSSDAGSRYVEGSEGAGTAVDSTRTTVIPLTSNLSDKSSPSSVKCTTSDDEQGNKNEEGRTFETPQEPQHSKDKKFWFVYYLTRVYGRRMKDGGGKRNGNDNKNRKEKEKIKTKDSESEKIGERMAQMEPLTLDRTLSLTPHQNVGHIKKDEATRSKDINVFLSSEIVPNDNCRHPIVLSNSMDAYRSLEGQSGRFGQSLDDVDFYSSGHESDDGNNCFESYYEKQLSLDLADTCGEAVYSHEEKIASVDDDSRITSDLN